jgi:hypothetical protein
MFPSKSLPKYYCQNLIKSRIQKANYACNLNSRGDGSGPHLQLGPGSEAIRFPKILDLEISAAARQPGPWIALNPRTHSSDSDRATYATSDIPGKSSPLLRLTSSPSLIKTSADILLRLRSLPQQPVKTRLPRCPEVRGGTGGRGIG